MKKFLKAIGLSFHSELKQSQKELENITHAHAEAVCDIIDLKAKLSEAHRKLEIQAEQHKKIEEIKIAQVNLAISGENDRLKTRLAEVVGEMNDLEHRYAVAKLEIQQAQSDIDLAAENSQLRQRLAELAAHHKRTEAGVKTLVTFIHRTHRLHMPFVDGTIRAAIQKGLNRNGG